MRARNQPPGPLVRVEVENEWVWCGEQRLKLTPKAFAVVRYLAEHAGKLVTKDQLLHVVWPDTVVSEWALTSCLWGDPQDVVRIRRRPRSILRPRIDGGFASSGQ